MRSSSSSKIAGSAYSARCTRSGCTSIASCSFAAMELAILARQALEKPGERAVEFLRPLEIRQMPRALDDHEPRAGDAPRHVLGHAQRIQLVLGRADDQ